MQIDEKGNKMIKQGPIIFYGENRQQLHPNQQYILMKLGIGNGQYSGLDFARRVEEFDSSNVKDEQGRHDVSIAQTVLITFSQLKPQIEIRDFEPNEQSLERFVNTPLDRMQIEIDEALSRASGAIREVVGRWA